MFDNQFQFPSSEFDEALRIDHLIFQLALYEISQGYISIPSDMDKTASLQNESIKKFNHFKKLIQNGEMTLAELSSRIANNYGPFLKKKVNEEQEIEDLIDPNPKKTNKTNKTNKEEMVDKMIDSLFNMMGKREDKSGNLKIFTMGAGNLENLEKYCKEYDDGNKKEQKQIGEGIIKENKKIVRKNKTKKNEKRNKKNENDYYGNDK